MGVSHTTSHPARCWYLIDASPSSSHRRHRQPRTHPPPAMRPPAGLTPHWPSIVALLRQFPLLVVAALLLWAHYSVVVSLCIRFLVLDIQRYRLAILLGVPFQVVWALAVWSLAACIAWGPGCVESANAAEEGRKWTHRAQSTATPFNDDADEDSTPLLHVPPPPDSGGVSPLPPPYASSRLTPRSPLSHRHSHDDDMRSGLDFVAALQSIPPPPPRSSSSDALMCKSDGSRRFCRKCQAFKPDRAHHCSSCGRCILKMDHHCPWLGGRCVGIRNQKPFILFICYTTCVSFLSALSAGLGLSTFVAANPRDNFELAPLNWAFLLLIGFFFTLVIGGFSIYHIWLVSNNRTTIENMERGMRVKPVAETNPSTPDQRQPSSTYALLRPNRPTTSTPSPMSLSPYSHHYDSNVVADVSSESLPSYTLPIYKSDDVLSRSERNKLERATCQLNVYDVGFRENWKQVMGINHQSGGGWFHYLIPTHPKGISDGFSFQVNQEHLTNLQRLTAQIRLVPSDRSHELRYERP